VLRDIWNLFLFVKLTKVIAFTSFINVSLMYHHISTEINQNLYVVVGSLPGPIPNCETRLTLSTGARELMFCCISHTDPLFKH